MLKLSIVLAFLLGAATPAIAELRLSIPAEDEAGRVSRMIMDGGQQTIYASGEIAPGDVERFLTFVRANKVKDAKVAFNSGGGSLVEALRLGNAIRSLGFDTTVSAERNGRQAVCASACAYAYAGGVNRYADEYSGRLGIHQFYAPGKNEGDVGQVQLVSGLIVAYLDKMGVDAKAFSLAATAGAEEMVWLAPADAEALGLANNGAQPPTAEIKTIDMVPYLRLEQKRAKGQARVLLMCDAGKPHIMAGVVATPDEAAFHGAISKRSYLELDGAEALVAGPGGAKAEDSVLWLSRSLDNSTARKLLRANMLDIWTEGGGAVRWGGSLDLRLVRQKIASYLSDCVAG